MSWGSYLKNAGFGLILAANNCASPSPSSLDTITITEALTNTQGIAYLVDKDNGEEVEIVVRDDKKNPIADARVLYFDGIDFECFRPEREGYTPSAMTCYDHNSQHTLRLTVNPLQAAHEHTSQRALGKFVDYAKAQWDYYGCRTAQEVRGLASAGSWVVQKISSLFTLGISDKGIEEATEYLQQQWDDDVDGHWYSFIPREHGFRSTTTISVLDARLHAEEVPDNQIDDDCNGEVDENNSHPMPDAGVPDITVGDDLEALLELCRRYYQKYYFDCADPTKRSQKMTDFYKDRDCQPENYEELRKNRARLECANQPTCQEFRNCI